MFDQLDDFDPTTDCDMVAEYLSDVFFCYGCFLPQDRLFVAYKFADERLPKVESLNREKPDKIVAFFEELSITCRRDHVTLSAIGFMDSFEDWAICVCQDNFLYKRDCMIMPIDNEDAPDCMIVDIRGNFSKVPQQVSEFQAMYASMWENMVESNAINVAG